MQILLGKAPHPSIIDRLYLRKGLLMRKLAVAFAKCPKRVRPRMSKFRGERRKWKGTLAKSCCQTEAKLGLVECEILGSWLLWAGEWLVELKGEKRGERCDGKAWTQIWVASQLLWPDLSPHFSWGSGP